MARKPSKARKIITIVLTVILAHILTIALLIGVIVIGAGTPHKMHFSYIYLTNNRKDDGKYLYHVSEKGKVSYVRSDVDLREVFGLDIDKFDELGGHDLLVRAKGFEIYRTDMSGIFVSYPVISYEYVPE